MPLCSFSRRFAATDAPLALCSYRLKQRLVSGQPFPSIIAQFIFGLDFTVGHQPFRVAGTVDNECSANLAVEGYSDATQNDGAGVRCIWVNNIAVHNDRGGNDALGF